MFTHPGKKLLFMGGDIGQWQEWSEARSLDWHLLEWEPHRKLNRYVRDLNRLYRREPALYQWTTAPPGFEWIDYRDWESSVAGCICARPRPGRSSTGGRATLRRAARWLPGRRAGALFLREVFNSDSEVYWGSNMGNQGGCGPSRSRGRASPAR